MLVYRPRKFSVINEELFENTQLAKIGSDTISLATNFTLHIILFTYFETSVNLLVFLCRSVDREKPVNEMGCMMVEPALNLPPGP